MPLPENGWSTPEDANDSDNDTRVTLSSINTRKCITLSMKASYTKWGPREAFRELVQNWRDAIIASFGIDENALTVAREEKVSDGHIDIIYKASANSGYSADGTLGYIRFEGRDGVGNVNICNREATLQPWHLDLGATSKADDPCQAGCHGEGMKLAALVLMRDGQNHSLTCRSGGFIWRFNFTKTGRLVVRLERIPAHILCQENTDTTPLGLLPFAANSKKDVRFLLGEEPGKRERTRDQRGNQVERCQIKVDDFKQWVKSSLFLIAQDREIVSTVDGDLLLDPDLRGCLYLKGLLLAESTKRTSASRTSVPLKFGYNFSSGATNRERSLMANANEESERISAIWGRALQLRPELVSELSDMLNSEGKIFADVYHAKRFLSYDTVQCLKKHLCRDSSRRLWYYCDENDETTLRVQQIIRGLGKEPAVLPKKYWDIMWQHALLRTAEEEEKRQFMRRPVLDDIPDTFFSGSVRRILSACLRACPYSLPLSKTFCFVQAGELELDLYLATEDSNKTPRIHDRWLFYDKATAELGLEETSPRTDVIFHTVKRLFSSVLQQLLCQSKDSPARRRECTLAEQRVLEYLRWTHAKVSISCQARGLVLLSPINDVHSGAKLEIHCHRGSQCIRQYGNVLLAHEARSVASLECFKANQHPCLSFSVDFKNASGYEVKGFEVGVEYFLMFVPEDPMSFVVPLRKIIILAPCAHHSAESSVCIPQPGLVQFSKYSAYHNHTLL
jgi:hypothetical protein